jgi:hypothetical protein
VLDYISQPGTNIKDISNTIETNLRRYIAVTLCVTTLADTSNAISVSLFINLNLLSNAFNRTSRLSISYRGHSFLPPGRGGGTMSVFSKF